jgi:hypothetical protein
LAGAAAVVSAVAVAVSIVTYLSVLLKKKLFVCQ